MKRRIVLIVALILVLSGCSISKNEQASANMNEGIHLETKINIEIMDILGEQTNVEISYPQIVNMKDRKIRDSVNEALRQYFIEQNEFVRNRDDILYTDFKQKYLDEEYLSLIFEYGIESKENEGDAHKVFVAVNVDLTTGLFENINDFLAKFGNEYKTEDLDNLWFLINEEFKADNQINPLHVNKSMIGDKIFDNVGFYREEAGLVIYYYDGQMQEIHIPKNRLGFMFPSDETQSE